MPFGVATVLTSVGKAITAKRQIGATPAQAPPVYLAMGTGATGAARTAAAGDTALSTEAETRVSGTASTVTTSVTNDTYQLTGTQSATASRAVDEAGIFDASSVGNMFASATMNVLNLNNGDSITWTWKIQYQ